MCFFGREYNNTKRHGRSVADEPTILGFLRRGSYQKLPALAAQPCKSGDHKNRRRIRLPPVVFQGKVYLYYSATGRYVDSVGLAISEDGEHFTKYGAVMPGRAPASVVWNDMIYMVTQYRGKLFLHNSEDGIHFRMLGPLEGVSVEELMQTKKEAQVTQSKVSEILDLAPKAVAMAMGIAVTVLTVLDALEVKSAMIMLGIGLACAGISMMGNKSNIT